MGFGVAVGLGVTTGFGVGVGFGVGAMYAPLYTSTRYTCFVTPSSAVTVSLKLVVLPPDPRFFLFTLTFAPGEADTVVCAGMGGDAITDILSAAPWSRAGPLLLLQPMSKAEVLRAWLPLNGYEVFREELVQDKGVLYPILSVRGGKMAPASDAQAWGGFLLDRDPLWGLYIADRLLRLRRAAAGLKKARDPSLAAKRERILEVIACLEEKKGEWERAVAAGR